jgi:hypothetical protein
VQLWDWPPTVQSAPRRLVVYHAPREVVPGLVTATIRHPAGIAGHLKLAQLSKSKATIGGALAAALEN